MALDNDETSVVLIEELKETSDNISKIINTIDYIAFQLNLLSLKAATEAARAGEHGKGFIAVAEETRNLALFSQTSASEANDLLPDILHKISEIMDIHVNTVKR